MARTITSINATALLTAPGVYDQAQTLQGWSTDDAFTTGDVKIVETQFGIDGVLSMGKVNAPRQVIFTLQADSPSNIVMDNIVGYMESIDEVAPCQIVITIPGVQMTYSLSNGTLTDYTPWADVRKTLQPRKFTFVFGSVVAAPTA